jgi:hypothetical protein
MTGFRQPQLSGAGASAETRRESGAAPASALTRSSALVHFGQETGSDAETDADCQQAADVKKDEERGRIVRRLRRCPAYDLRHRLGCGHRCRFLSEQQGADERLCFIGGGRHLDLQRRQEHRHEG